MAQVKQGDTIRVHYTGKLEDGTVFDSSASRDPLQFTLGKGQTIPGFEQAVVGMNPGESKTARISADQAYGPRRDDMVIAVERQQLPADLQPEIGQQLQISQTAGQEIPVVVTDVSEARVTLDANHPLAGEDLIFDIQLLEIA